jgi:hypothetical protein
MAEDSPRGKWGERIFQVATGVLFAALTATITWAWNTEKRVSLLEVQNSAQTAEISVLRAKDESIQQMRTDLAVVSSKQETAAKQMDRIETLLEKLVH